MSMTTSELASERASEHDESLALVASGLGGDVDELYAETADELDDDDSDDLLQSAETIAEMQERARASIRTYLAKQGDADEDDLEYPTAVAVGTRYGRGRSWGRQRIDEVKLERKMRAEAVEAARAELGAAAEAAAREEPEPQEKAVVVPAEMPSLERLLAADGPINVLRRETFGYTRDIAMLAAEVSGLVQALDFNSEQLGRREQELLELEKRFAAAQRASELDSERASKRRQRQERRRQQVADDAHLIVNTSLTRFVAWLAFALGAIASVAANVLHAMTVGGTGGAARLIYAGLWPVALLLAVEVLTRARVPRRGMYSIARYGATLLVAFVAAAVSYRHMVDLLAHWGEDAFNAHIGPLAVDGLMVVAGVALLGISQGRVVKKKELTAELAKIAAQEQASERA